MRFRFRLGSAAFLLLSAAHACGGQSGNEGELPAAPCARERAVIVGRINRVGDTVRVRVERVVATSEEQLGDHGQIIFDGEPTPDDLLEGELDSTYAWRHPLAVGDSVAAVLWWSGEQLHLQLFAFEDELVQANWGRVELQLTLAELTATDCDAKLLEEHGDQLGDDVVESTSCTVRRVGQR